MDWTILDHQNVNCAVFLEVERRRDDFLVIVDRQAGSALVSLSAAISGQLPSLPEHHWNSSNDDIMNFVLINAFILSILLLNMCACCY